MPIIWSPGRAHCPRDRIQWIDWTNCKARSPSIVSIAAYWFGWVGRSATMALCNQPKMVHPWKVTIVRDDPRSGPGRNEIISRRRRRRRKIRIAHGHGTLKR